jgi:hypothetical protein
MMDANSGKVIQSFPISAGVEANVFESSTGLLFVSTREASMVTSKPANGGQGKTGGLVLENTVPEESSGVWDRFCSGFDFLCVSTTC